MVVIKTDEAWPPRALVESELTKLCSCAPAVPAHPNKFLAFETREEPQPSVAQDQVTRGTPDHLCVALPHGMLSGGAPVLRSCI